MKYIIILGDGMADRPIAELGNKTPLMAANTPNIDELCRKGRCGRLITVPDDMPPGSEIANMAVLGYDVKKVYQGRGVLEAASMGIELEDTDIAMRCNLICIENEKIKNHSAGHISNVEAKELITVLQDKLETEKVKFYPGVSYRHLLVIKGEKNNVKCTPPHDVPGSLFKDVLVKPVDDDVALSNLLNNLIFKSQEILSKHPVNQKRVSEGKDPANSIWPWSPGIKPKMKTLQELYGVSGAMISAVDLLYGIGKYAGMKAVKVKGSTGLYTTNYEGKAKAAVDALKEVDLVYLHIEASDEAGHEGDYELKKKTIEYLDSRVVKYIMKETAKMDEPVTIALIPDHPTPCDIKTHTRDAVPFIIFKPDNAADSVLEYNEESVNEGYYGTLKGNGFMLALLNTQNEN
ncbi:MAG TPA: cofactor-independent phosphoglycerate mutase [Thermotogaceae bacterium]|nr:cofactor-independent phosphoglycerate mutase [Thermotogaceae bacterium]